MRWWSILRGCSGAAIIALGFLALPAVSVAQDAKELAAPDSAKELAPGSREWEGILPVAQNLKLDGEAATKAKKPILIFFNLTGCHYCRGALREVIVPMFRNAGWRAAIEFRQVTIDDGKSLIDFDGKTVENIDFAKQRKGTFTPTVMVVDGRGQLLGDPIIGIANFDFYGGYVDALAKKAIEEMRARP
jgi:thioredoxin-related protein